MQYEIKGEPMPVVICTLDAGEKMITESGSMTWMTPNVEMSTGAGGVGKAFGRMFSGETLFQNTYTAKGAPGLIAFGSSFPGSIRAIEITPERPIICQKSAFLAGTEGIELSVFIQNKALAGFFGGEGFIMQKVAGRGIAFIEIDGTAIEYYLEPGRSLIVDTGYVSMMDATMSIDVDRVKGAKNMLFGGEGLFNTIVTGPGTVVLQTQPLPQFARSIAAMIPSSK